MPLHGPNHASKGRRQPFLPRQWSAQGCASLFDMPWCRCRLSLAQVYRVFGASVEKVCRPAPPQRVEHYFAAPVPRWKSHRRQEKPPPAPVKVIICAKPRMTGEDAGVHGGAFGATTLSELAWFSSKVVISRAPPYTFRTKKRPILLRKTISTP